MHFIGRPLVEEHKQVGHLISIFEMDYCLTLLEWSWQITVIPTLVQYGSDFSAQVSLHSQANDFFFFQDSLPGVSHYVYFTYDVVVLENTHLVSQTLFFQSKVFDTIHIMTFLGTISNICGNVLRGLLKSATACIFLFFFLGGCSLVAVPILLDLL